MNDGRIATRYAKALLQWGNSEGTAREIYDAALILSPVMLEQAMSLSQTLGSSVIPIEKKIEFSERFFAPHAVGLQRLAELMIRKGRGHYLPRAILVYTELFRKQEGIVHVEVHSAQGVEQAQRNRLEEYLKQKFGDKIEMVFHENSNLIGGFQLFVQGKRYDKSVRGELTRMALAMRQ